MVVVTSCDYKQWLALLVDQCKKILDKKSTHLSKSQEHQWQVASLLRQQKITSNSYC